MAGNQTQKTNNRIISCAIFLQPGIVVLICFIILSFGANWTRLYMSIFLLIGFYFTTWSLIRYYTTKINTNNNEYYIQSGLINKIKIKLPTSKKESIVTHQNLAGQILNYGTLWIKGIGGSDYSITYIKSKELEKIISNNK